MMESFFASDLHFGHKFMADLRGFGRLHLEAMDEFIIEGWNAKVGKNDEVFFLGDLSFYNAEMTEKCFNALNGRYKHLYRGNHDPRHILRLNWESVQDFGSRKFMPPNPGKDEKGQRVYMMHYPMLTWPNAHHGTWHFHGHSHGNGRWGDSTRVDVGMDALHLVGIEGVVASYDELAAVMATRKYDYVDHHEEGSN